MKKFTTLALAVASTLTLGTASALVISDTASFAGVTTELNDQTLTVDLFDDMGGTRTLNSVTVSVSGNVNASGTVTNTSTTSTENFTVTEVVNQFDGTPAGPTPLTSLFVFPTSSPFGTTVGSQTYNLAPSTSGVFEVGPGTPYSISGADSLVLTAPGDLAAFIGPGGTFDYLFNTVIGLFISGGGGNVSTAINTVAGGTLTVEYDFDEVIAPVPVPASLLMIALGLLGLRRARSNVA